MVQSFEAIFHVKHPTLEMSNYVMKWICVLTTRHGSRQNILAGKNEYVSEPGRRFTAAISFVRSVPRCSTRAHACFTFLFLSDAWSWKYSHMRTTCFCFCCYFLQILGMTTCLPDFQLCCCLFVCTYSYERYMHAL